MNLPLKESLPELYQLDVLTQFLLNLRTARRYIDLEDLQQEENKPKEDSCK